MFLKSYIKRFNVGKFQIDLAIQDWFRLDGGIIFSGIPREKWKTFSMGVTTLIDEQSRVQLSINCFLIKTPDNKHILIDTSFGESSQWKPEIVEAFHMQNGFNLFEDRSPLKLPRPDFIIPTHLHFDHAGGLIRGAREEERDGNFRLRFPLATHIFHEEELKHAFKVHPKTRSSYLRETIAGLKFLLNQAPRVKIINTSTFEIVKGVTLIKTRGHTPGHLAVKIESEGQTLFIPGGLAPTRYHINIVACGVGNDTHGLEAIDRKIKFLKKAAKENWLLLLEHDPEVAGYVTQQEKDKFIFTPHQSER